MSFFRRLFGRKTPPAPRDVRGWNEDWQVGDLARCINRSGWSPPEPFDPKFGDIPRVSGLWEGKSFTGSFIGSGLKFEGKPQNRIWHCIAFVKIRPETTVEEVETGIIAKIKRAARKGAGVSA